MRSVGGKFEYKRVINAWYTPFHCSGINTSNSRKKAAKVSKSIVPVNTTTTALDGISRERNGFLLLCIVQPHVDRSKWRKLIKQLHFESFLSSHKVKAIITHLKDKGIVG